MECGMTDDRRREVVEALEAFQAASVQLRQLLGKIEVDVSEILRQVQAGEHFLSVLEREDLPRLRAELADELRRFGAARHEMRVVSFRLAVTENATVSDLARGWGISRQLASKFAQEAAARGAASTAPESLHH
jgi:hypothetical protein